MELRNGIQGADNHARKCGTCGGYPLVSIYFFTTGDLPDGVRGEWGCYMHCPCGDEVTEWYRPSRKADGTLKKGAVQLAKSAWQKKNLIKSKED